jgi:hypothetical protein
MTTAQTKVKEDKKEIILSTTESGEVEKVFSEAKDFRSI